MKSAFLLLQEVVTTQHFITTQCLCSADSEMTSVDQYRDPLDFQSPAKCHRVQDDMMKKCEDAIRSPPKEASRLTCNDAKQAHTSVPYHSVQCPSCTATYHRNKDLRKHYKTSHLDIKIIKCNLCHLEVKSGIDSYLSHQKTHSIKGEFHKCKKTQEGSKRTCKCPKCDKQVSYNCLKRHINCSHTGKKIYTCPDCPAIYLDASNLLNHRKRNHMGQEVRRHLCEVCGKKFLQPSDLRTHVAGVHHNVKKYVCEYCGVGFKISSALMYHRRIHTGEKPHECHVCKASFMKPNGLARHIRRVHCLEYQGKYRKRVRSTQPFQATSSQFGQSDNDCKKKEKSMEKMKISQLMPRDLSIPQEEISGGKDEQPIQNSGCQLTTDMQFLAQTSETQVVIPTTPRTAQDSPSFHEITVLRPVPHSLHPASDILTTTPCLWHDTFKPNYDEVDGTMSGLVTSHDGSQQSYSTVISITTPTTATTTPTSTMVTTP